MTFLSTLNTFRDRAIADGTYTGSYRPAATVPRIASVESTPLPSVQLTPAASPSLAPSQIPIPLQAYTPTPVTPQQLAANNAAPTGISTPVKVALGAAVLLVLFFLFKR